MKMVQSFLVFLSMGLALVACGGKKVVLSAENNVKKDGISMGASTVKDKGKKFDVKLNITNESSNDIIIMLNDMQCFKGGTQGELKHTFFGAGERTIDFRKGQMKSFSLVCVLPGKAAGPYRIVVGRVFDNPESDGKSRGKVLSTNIEWSVPQN